MCELVLIPSGRRWVVLDEDDVEIGSYPSQHEAWIAIQDHVHARNEDGLIIVGDADGDWREQRLPVLRH